MEIVPFGQRFVEPAAEMLAAVHATLGDDSPTYSADADIAREQVNRWMGTGPAVAAVSGDGDGDGALVGFLAASVDGFSGAHVAKVRLHQHAAIGDDRDDPRMTYRRMYAALAERLVAIGCFEHTVVVVADRPEAQNAFVELGFGFDQIKGLRQLTPPAKTGGVVVRAAGAGDLARIVELTWELQQFHAEAPMLRPAAIDLPALRADLAAAVADDRRLVLLAEHDGQAAGLMVVDPDAHLPATATIGIAVVTAAVRGRALGTALLSGAVDWAAEQGFRRIAAGWTSANLVSDAFWRGHGFAPARHTLTRRIDPRVAWADARLDYRDLFPDR